MRERRLEHGRPILGVVIAPGTNARHSPSPRKSRRLGNRRPVEPAAHAALAPE
jgi:hypothetical protein